MVETLEHEVKTSKGLILVIDDNERHLDFIREVLSEQGYGVKTANSGWKGVNEYKTEEYNLVVTDYSMPDLSGIDVIQNILKINPNAKIILNTVDCSEDISEKAKQAGACEVVDKNLHRLMTIINTYARVV